MEKHRPTKVAQPFGKAKLLANESAKKVCVKPCFYCVFHGLLVHFLARKDSRDECSVYVFVACLSSWMESPIPIRKSRDSRRRLLTRNATISRPLVNGFLDALDRVSPSQSGFRMIGTRFRDSSSAKKKKSLPTYLPSLTRFHVRLPSFRKSNAKQWQCLPTSTKLDCAGISFIRFHCGPSLWSRFFFRFCANKRASPLRKLHWTRFRSGSAGSFPKLDPIPNSLDPVFLRYLEQLGRNDFDEGFIIFLIKR